MKRGHMNRAQRMVRLLEKAGADGVCLNDMPEQMRYCGRNAVSEAIAKGAKIISRPCHKHQHGSSVSRYFLKGAAEPATAGKAESVPRRPTELPAATPLLFPEPQFRGGSGK